MLSPVKLPDKILSAGIAFIDAGSDTSSLITKDGRLYTFGNSVRLHLAMPRTLFYDHICFLQEYAQAFHGEKIDRIMEPKHVDTSPYTDNAIQSFKTAGSSSLLLDGELPRIASLKLLLLLAIYLMKPAGAIRALDSVSCLQDSVIAMFIDDFFIR